MSQRAVITGVGIIAPNGTGKEAFWRALIAGESGIKKITRFDITGYPSKFAGEVVDFRPEDHFERKKLRFLSRFAQFALVATRTALGDAGVKIAAEIP